MDRKMYLHSWRLLVVKEDIEIFLTLESHGLLRAHLRASREENSCDASGSAVRGRCGGEVGCLDVMNTDVGEFDVLGLELTTERGTVESGAENGSLISVDILRDLVPVGLLAYSHMQCREYALSNDFLESCLNHWYS